MREIIKDILKKNPDLKVVGEADNGGKGFERYKELKPDLVTLDIVMENVTGIEMLQKVIEYNKDAVVLMITSIGQEKYVKQCLDIGAKGVIVKPFSEEEVLDTIKSVIPLIKKGK